jgi:AP-4 complex subunit mu-1
VRRAATVLRRCDVGCWQDKTSQPSTATNKPVIASLSDRRSGKQQNEIYVDLLERLSVIFNSSVRAAPVALAVAAAVGSVVMECALGAGCQGALLKCEVDGALSMKSYLTGGPEIRLGLNSELVIGRRDAAGGAPP